MYQEQGLWVCRWTSLKLSFVENLLEIQDTMHSRFETYLGLQKLLGMKNGEKKYLIAKKSPERYSF